MRSVRCDIVSSSTGSCPAVPLPDVAPGAVRGVAEAAADDDEAAPGWVDWRWELLRSETTALAASAKRSIVSDASSCAVRTSVECDADACRKEESEHILQSIENRPTWEVFAAAAVAGNRDAVAAAAGLP